MKIEISATQRKVQGTGASRRLRRSGRVPGIVYGGEQGAVNIDLDHKELYRNLINEKFHASILTLKLEGGAEQDRRRVDVVHRDIEEALDLVGMQVHRQHARHAHRCEHVGHHLGADGNARRARAPVLARVAEVRNRGGDAAGRGALQRVGHDHQFHQVVVGRRAGGLQHEYVLATHVLHDLDHHFAIGELADNGAAERQVEVLRHLLREARRAVAGEHHQAVHRRGRGVRELVHNVTPRPSNGWGGRIRTLEWRNQNPLP